MLLVALYVYGTKEPGQFVGWVFLVPFALVGLILQIFGRLAKSSRPAEPLPATGQGENDIFAPRPSDDLDAEGQAVSGGACRNDDGGPACQVVGVEVAPDAMFVEVLGGAMRQGGITVRRTENGIVVLEELQHDPPVIAFLAAAGVRLAIAGLAVGGGAGAEK